MKYAIANYRKVPLGNGVGGAKQEKKTYSRLLGLQCNAVELSGLSKQIAAGRYEAEHGNRTGSNVTCTTSSVSDPLSYNHVLPKASLSVVTS